MGLTDAALLSLSEKCQELGVLVLRGCRDITDAGLVQLPTTVDSLMLANVPGITNAALESIAKLENLYQLELNDCTYIDDEGIAHLTK